MNLESALQPTQPQCTKCTSIMRTAGLSVSIWMHHHWC